MYGKKKFIALIVAVSIIGCGLMLPTTANAAEKNTEKRTEILDMLSGEETTFYDGDNVITVTESTEENHLKSLDLREHIGGCVVTVQKFPLHNL